MKAAKRLLGATSVVLCEAPSEAQLRRWLEQRADPPFERGVVDVLIARCAGGKMGLAALVAEVDKLCLLAGPGGRIDRAMVESLVAESSADGLFDLVKPVSEGRTGAALEVLGNMLRDGAVDRSGKRQRDPRAITPMAIGTFRWDLARLWSAYALIQQGMREDAAQRALGGYGARDALRRARAASHGSLCARHDALRRADRAVKSGARALDTLTRLVIELSELSRPPAGRGARPPPGPSGRSRSSGSRP